MEITQAYQLFFEYLEKTIPLNQTSQEIIRNTFAFRKLKKRQYFLQEGNIAYHTAWIAKGCLRTFTINQNGMEQTMQFSVEGWWATDMFSFLSGEPAAFNIEALEDTSFLILDKIGRDLIFEKIPGFERLMRILIENHLVAHQKRLNAALSLNAEERYLIFLKKYPDIVQRVPQHLVASYLGITPETLSRIRKNLISG